MSFLKNIWAFIAMLLTGAFILCVMTPAYLLTLPVMALIAGSAKRFRQLNSAFMFWSNRPSFWLYCRLMNIDISYSFLYRRPFHPAIVVANHQSIADIFIIMTLLPNMGCQDARWVMKESLRWIPFIGWLTLLHGSAHIDRKNWFKAEAKMSRAARHAHADQASFVIFPEGTRFVPRPDGYPDPAGGLPYMRVRTPRLRGFELCRRILPRHDLVVVAIDYGGALEIKNFWQLGKLVNRRIRVRADRERHRFADADWLNATWRTMDDRLRGDFYNR